MIFQRHCDGREEEYIGRDQYSCDHATQMVVREGNTKRVTRRGRGGGRRRDEGGDERVTFIVISVSLVAAPSVFTDCNRTCSRELE